MRCASYCPPNRAEALAPPHLVGRPGRFCPPLLKLKICSATGLPAGGVFKRAAATVAVIVGARESRTKVGWSQCNRSMGAYQSKAREPDDFR